MKSGSSDGAGTFFSNVIISNYEIELGEGYHVINFDVARVVETQEHIQALWSAIKVWLLFDNSSIEDLLSNTWTTNGTPTIGTTGAISNNALQLDGSSSLHSSVIELCGQDFTVDAYVYMDSTSGSGAEVFYIGNSSGFLVLVVRNSGKLQLWLNQYATI